MTEKLGNLIHGGIYESFGLIDAEALLPPTGS